MFAQQRIPGFQRQCRGTVGSFFLYLRCFGSRLFFGLISFIGVERDKLQTIARNGQQVAAGSKIQIDPVEKLDDDGRFGDGGRAHGRGGCLFRPRHGFEDAQLFFQIAEFFLVGFSFLALRERRKINDVHIPVLVPPPELAARCPDLSGQFLSLDSVRRGVELLHQQRRLSRVVDDPELHFFFAKLGNQIIILRGAVASGQIKGEA